MTKIECIIKTTVFSKKKEQILMGFGCHIYRYGAPLILNHCVCLCFKTCEGLMLTVLLVT